MKYTKSVCNPLKPLGLGLIKTDFWLKCKRFTKTSMKYTNLASIPINIRIENDANI
jgi:hypothetical protein